MEAQSPPDLSPVDEMIESLTRQLLASEDMVPDSHDPKGGLVPLLRMSFSRGEGGPVLTLDTRREVADVAQREVLITTDLETRRAEIAEFVEWSP